MVKADTMEADLLGLNAATTFPKENEETALVLLSSPIHGKVSKWSVTQPQQGSNDEDILLRFQDTQFVPPQEGKVEDREAVPPSQEKTELEVCNGTKTRQISDLSSPMDLACMLSNRTANTGSTVATLSSLTVTSLLEDITFAPPPPFPTMDKLVRFEFMAEREADNKSLPNFTKVKHSGKILSRVSILSLISKSWKETFWIIYDEFQLIFFRNERDYEDWLLNPYIDGKERDDLIKLKIDLEKDLQASGSRGYQITKIRKKEYRKGGIIHQFKVDSMTAYGPSLVGAFGSSDISQATQLHCLLRELMRRSPLNSKLLNISNANIDGRQENSQQKKLSMSTSGTSSPFDKPTPPK